MPLVSVVVPTFNRNNILQQAIESVFAQTFRDIEIIVVDDGSVDNTWLLIQQLCERAKSSGIPIQCLRQEHTGFPGQVRNKGAAGANGKFIAFLDDDDLWLPDKLSRQVQLMQLKEAAFLSHTREKWVRNGKEISQAGQKHNRSGYIFEDCLNKCIIGPSTSMLTSTLFHSLCGFDPTLEIAEDYEFWLRVTVQQKVDYIDRKLTIKRAGHGSQLSEKYGYIEKFRILALKGILDRYERFGLNREQFRVAGIELVRKAKIYANGCLKRNKLEEGRYFDSVADFYEGVGR